MAELTLTAPSRGTDSAASDEDLPGRHAAIRDGQDSARAPVAVVSLALLVLGLVGWGVGNVAAQATGFILFALIGFGSAWLIVLQGRKWSFVWPVLALGPSVGLALVILVGFVLVETKIWYAGPGVFAALAAGAATVHVHVLTSAARQRHSVASKPETEIEEGHERLAISSATLSSLVIALAVIGVSLCLLSAAELNPFDPGPSGLFTVISPAWYLGLALIVAAIVVGQRLSGLMAGLPVVALGMAVTLTPTLAYQLPRYSWTAKHVGVASSILLHGSVSSGADIYQAWPGLFAATAWLCRVGGIHDPMLVARWWPPVVDLATVLAFQYLAFRVLRNSRRAWLAAAILFVGNTIGQDYFSPQSTGFLLAIAVFVIAFRHREEPRRMAAGEWVTLVAITFAIAITHQLTPYMVTAALLILVLFDLARSRVLPLVSLLPAVAWALIHLSTVRLFFKLNQLGDVASNVLTRGLSTTGLHRSSLIVSNSVVIVGSALVISLLALAVLIRSRTRTHLAVALCAASGAGLLLANSYGNEGSFRVLLFALPWLAILAVDWDPARRRGRHLRPSTKTLLWAVTLPILLGAYLFADMGLDYMNAVRPGDLQAVRTFERTASAGSVLFVLGNGYMPLNTSGRYSKLYEVFFLPIVTVSESPTSKGEFDPSLSYQEFMHSAIPHSSKLLKERDLYVLTAQQPATRVIELGELTRQDYRSFNAQIASSQSWDLVTHTATASLYKLGSLVFNTKAPLVNGTPQDGMTVTADRGGWSSLKPLAFGFQWKLCDGTGATCEPIVGATHDRLKLGAVDLGHKVVLVVTATDQTGHTMVVTSAPVGPVGNSPLPKNTVLPMISGATSVGKQLIVSTGGWQTPLRFTLSYQWQRCDSLGANCMDISGAISQAFRVTTPDLGHEIAVIVTAHDEQDQTAEVMANPVGPVTH